jgi:hypothetical protein
MGYSLSLDGVAAGVAGMQPVLLLSGVAAAAAGPLVAAAPAVGFGRPDMGLAILLGAFSLETGAVGGGSTASPEAVGGGNTSPEAVKDGSESPEAVSAAASGSSAAGTDGSGGGGGSATASAAEASGELIANVHCARTECPDCHFSEALGF